MAEQRKSGRQTRGDRKPFVPKRPPEGRVIKFRVSATGGPRNLGSEDRFEEHRLGKDPTGDDFNPLFCLARSKNHHGQCGKRPLKGRQTCATHGKGSPVRVKRGEIPSASANGRAAQAVQQVRKLAAAMEPIHLDPFLNHLEEFEMRERALADEPERLDLELDARHLTVLKEMILSGNIAMEASSALRAVTSLVDAKTMTMLRKHQLEVKDYVPGARVREIITALVDIIRTHVPEEHLEQVAKKLRLLAPSATLTAEEG